MKFLHLLLLLAASLLSFWLGFGKLPMPGCGVAGGGCGDVISSPYSRVFTLPVGMMGGGIYVTLFAIYLYDAIRDSISSPGLHFFRRFLEGLVIFAAIWFVVIQLFVIRKFCPWCSATHFCAVGAVVFACAARRRVASPLSHRFRFVGTLGAFATVVVFAFLQISHAKSHQGFGHAIVVADATQDNAAQGGPSSPQITLLETGLPVGGKLVLFSNPGSLSFPRSSVPILHGGLDTLAAPSGGVPLVFLHDWTCSHCQALHLLMLKARSAAHSPAVRITSPSSPPLPDFTCFMLPAWLDADGERIHRLMLTAWLGARPVYVAAEDALLDGSLKPEPEAVAQFITSRNGASWPDLWNNLAPSVDSIMVLGKAAFDASSSRLSYSTLPQLIAPHATLVGAPEPGQLSAFLHAAGEAAAGGHLILERRAIAAVFTPTASGQPHAPSPVVPSNLSEIEFEKETLTLPQLSAGASTQAVFSFANTGTEPLTITGVQTSCGCTVVSDWRQMIPPGGKGVIKADFNSAGRSPGMQTKTVTVRSTAKARPAVILSFSVEIIAAASSSTGQNDSPVPSHP